jgi:hydrogenase-1 operon protein HyaF
MAEPVLREIHARLESFAATGQTGAIDLAGMPLTRADREALEAFLGRGEVSATLDVAGRSEIWETAYSGVWWVRHWGGDAVASELIEFTAIPEILKTDRTDAAGAVKRLALTLQQRDRGSNGDGA